MVSSVRLAESDRDFREASPRAKNAGAVVAGIIAALVALAASHARSTPYDNYVYLADAWLHGRTAIAWPGPIIDAVSWHGSRIVIEAPLPAILLLPLVAIFGVAGWTQNVLSCILFGVAIAAAWRIARALSVSTEAAIFAMAFLAAGTDLLWCAMLGDVWMIAHVAAVAFTLLALAELLGARRGWLVAVFAACAVESRFGLVLALPVYALVLRDRRRLLSYGLTLVPFLLAWVGYNEIRWSLPYDVGYTAWYHQDSCGSPNGAPFSFANVPMQLQAFFVQGPSFVRNAPFVVPELGGMSLLWTSPALALALFARAPRRLVTGMWLATFACAAPNFCYYVTGFAQFGMRHALDFEPFLYVLLVLAFRVGAPMRLARTLIAYSVYVGIWGVIYWDLVYRPAY